MELADEQTHELANAVEASTEESLTSAATHSPSPADQREVIDRLMYFSGCSLPGNFVRKDVQDAVARGEKLIEDLLNPAVPLKAGTPQDIQDISWFIMARAAEKDLDEFQLRSFKGPESWHQGRIGNLTSEGMYRLQDPGGRVHAFLSSIPQCRQMDDRYFPHTSVPGKQHCYVNHENEVVLPGKGGAVWFGALQPSHAGGDPEIFVKFKQDDRSIKTVPYEKLKTALGTVRKNAYLDDSTKAGVVAILNTARKGGEANLKQALAQTKELLVQQRRRAEASGAALDQEKWKSSEQEYVAMIGDVLHEDKFAKDVACARPPLHPALMRRKEDVFKSGMNVFLSEYVENRPSDFGKEFLLNYKNKKLADPKYAGARPSVDTLIAALERFDQTLAEGNFGALGEALDNLSHALANAKFLSQSKVSTTKEKYERYQEYLARFAATVRGLETASGDNYGMERKGMEVLLSFNSRSAHAVDTTQPAGQELTARDYANHLVVPGRSNPTTPEIELRREIVEKLGKQALTIVDQSGYRIVASKAHQYEEVDDDILVELGAPATQAQVLKGRTYPPRNYHKMRLSTPDAEERRRINQNKYATMGTVYVNGLQVPSSGLSASQKESDLVKVNSQTVHHEIAHVISNARGRDKASFGLLSQKLKPFKEAWKEDLPDLSPYEKSDPKGEEALAESFARHVNNYGLSRHKSANGQTITREDTPHLAAFHENPDVNLLSPDNPRRHDEE
jgi:hypothetical protein